MDYLWCFYNLQICVEIVWMGSFCLVSWWGMLHLEACQGFEWQLWQERCIVGFKYPLLFCFYNVIIQSIIKKLIKFSFIFTSLFLTNKHWKQLHSASREAAFFCVFSCQGRKLQGQNCVGRPHSSAEHQTNGIFHLDFTPSLAAERVAGHESTVIMVSYCICTSYFFFFFFFHMNVPTGETIV